MQDMDPEVLAALPADIRRELRLALMARRPAAEGAQRGRVAPPQRAKRARSACGGTAPITDFYRRTT
jgi:hypothetical protein